MTSFPISHRFAICSDLDDHIKIAHNAKFDAKWVRHHLGAELAGVFDSYLASQLISAGDQDRRHGLADVAQYFLGEELDKSEQVSDWSAAELMPSQIEYAARDAAVMVPLREKLQERLDADDLSTVAQLEFDCVVPIAQMELNGFYLDEPRWREQLDKVRIAQSRAADELQDMLSAGVAQASLFGRAEINLDSQAQVTDALLNLGVPVPATTRGWQLQPLSGKISRGRQAPGISRRCQSTFELRREHSRIYRTRRPAACMPIFARSARRRVASHAQTQICSRYRTKKRTAAASRRLKERSS